MLISILKWGMGIVAGALLLSGAFGAVVAVIDWNRMRSSGGKRITLYKLAQSGGGVLNAAEVGSVVSIERRTGGAILHIDCKDSAFRLRFSLEGSTSGGGLHHDPIRNTTAFLDSRKIPYTRDGEFVVATVEMPKEECATLIRDFYMLADGAREEEIIQISMRKKSVPQQSQA